LIDNIFVFALINFFLLPNHSVLDAKLRKNKGKREQKKPKNKEQKKPKD
jgi:hypothetical protein